MNTPSALAVAAYGIRIEGLGAPAGLSLLGADTWPVVHFTRELTEDALPRLSEVCEDRATIAGPAAVSLLDRARAEVHVRSAEPVPEAELIHPGLWPVGAVFARWRGAETFHAGAFVPRDGDGAWALMAGSGGGKTSFLATLTLVGIEVLTDDLLVVKGGDCAAGPRSLDLRPDVVDRLHLADRVTTTVRATSRVRLPLDPCRARCPVHGFVELDWGEEIAVDRLPPSEGLAALARHRRVLGLGAEFVELLELLERPVLRLRRPRRWGSASEAVERLLDAIAAARV